MRKTTVVRNPEEMNPTQEELELIWSMMELDPEGGWLRKDHLGNVEQELDEDDLRKLLATFPEATRQQFGISLPVHLCGYYFVKRGVHMFIQWGA